MPEIGASRTSAATDTKPVVRSTGRSGVLYVAAGFRERAWSRERLLRIGPGAHVATNLTGALEQLRQRYFSLCLVDLADDRAALSMIRVIRAQHPEIPVAGIVDSAHPLMASEAIQAGVVDLLPWSFDEHDVAALLADAAERGRGRGQAPDEPLRGALVAHSAAMRQVVERVRVVSAHSRGVLVCGEPGTGRQTVARAVHRLDPLRSAATFVVVDLGGADPPAVERRLFGGAAVWTDDRSTDPVHLGTGCALLEAQGGTLLLRQATEVPLRVQTRLTRLLSDRAAIVPKRGRVAFDVRIICAIDSPAGEQGAVNRLPRAFRERVVPDRIDVPPLRHRREDIPHLAAALLREACVAIERERAVSRSAMALLAALPWPGNGRELADLVGRLVPRGEAPVIQIEEVLAEVSLEGTTLRAGDDLTLKEARARFERDFIAAVLTRHRGRMADAARALGIQRTNLYRKVRQLDVPRPAGGGVRHVYQERDKSGRKTGIPPVG